LLTQIKEFELGASGTAAIVASSILVAVLITAAVGYVLCCTGKCCKCFTIACVCCIPKKFRLLILSPRRKGEDSDSEDFDNINEEKTAEKKDPNTSRDLELDIIDNRVISNQ